MLQKYVSDYCSGFTFDHISTISCETGGISAIIEVFEYADDNNFREKAHITLRKNSAVYECDCIDDHHWDKMFFPLNLGGQDYLIFRKTLYGFTLINADTLEEEYDYFPEKVIGGGEAYIFTDALSFDDLIIFDGCFWACPYTYTAYDHAEKRFLCLYNEFPLESDDIPPRIVNDSVVLTCRNQSGDKTELRITSGELRRLIHEKGSADL